VALHAQGMRERAPHFPGPRRLSLRPRLPRPAPRYTGPVTFVLLSRCQLPHEEAVQRLLPTYGSLLRQLTLAGAPEVQIHEPCLATDKASGWRRPRDGSLGTCDLGSIWQAGVCIDRVCGCACALHDMWFTC
jgi:hypothetical protein